MLKRRHELPANPFAVRLIPLYKRPDFATGLVLRSETEAESGAPVIFRLSLCPFVQGGQRLFKHRTSVPP